MKHPLGKYVYQYPSLSALIDVAVNASSEMSTDNRASRRADEGGRGWSGGTWDDAKRLAIAGDIEGAKRLAPAMLKAVNSMVSGMPRLDPVYRLDEGRWIDVARFVKGEPECWGDMVESEPMKRKGAAVILNVAAHAGIRASTLDTLGVQVGSAVLGLQSMGQSVTLYVCEKIAGGSFGTASRHCYTIAPVNPGGCVLDVSRLSIVLRPWFLRRIMFSLNETWSKEARQGFGIPGGYGSPRPLTKQEAETLTGHKDAVIVDFDSAARYPDRVAEDIIRQIKGA